MMQNNTKNATKISPNVTTILQKYHNNECFLAPLLQNGHEVWVLFGAPITERARVLGAFWRFEKS